MTYRVPLPEGLYCPNPDCTLFGHVEDCKLERHAYYGEDRKVIYLCRACGRPSHKHAAPFSLGCEPGKKKC